MQRELKFPETIRNEYEILVASKPPDGSVARTKRDATAAPKGLSSSFQVLIQTTADNGANILTEEGLLKHVQIMDEVATLEVHLYNEYVIYSLCGQYCGFDRFTT